MTDSSLAGVPGGLSAFTQLDAPPPGFIHRPAEDIARPIDRITLVMDIVSWDMNKPRPWRVQGSG